MSCMYIGCELNLCRSGNRFYKPCPRRATGVLVFARALENFFFSFFFSLLPFVCIDAKIVQSTRGISLRKYCNFVMSLCYLK
jgi:hypothetical protein